MIRKKKEKFILELKHKNQHINVAFIYSSEKVITYKEIEIKINLILQRLLIAI